MAKNWFYEKLVCRFKSAINNDQKVNSEFYFTKFEKTILNKKKDNRYSTGIQQFLDYLKKVKNENALIFIFPEFKEKYQRFLEIVNSLEKKLPATAVKKSNFKSLVIQPFFTMLFFLQLFTKQITARPLEASRQPRSTDNCVIKQPNGYSYNDSFNVNVYLGDLQHSKGFSKLLKHKQSIEFKFKDTIFILGENSLSRQSLEKQPQTFCQADYKWFLSSMTIYLLRNKLRAEAHKQGLSQQNDAAFTQIIKDICSIDSNQQEDRQLISVDNLENFYEPKLEKFIFNSNYVRNIHLFTLDRGNSSDIVRDLNKDVSLKITALKNSQQKTEIGFASHFNSDNAHPLPENHSIIPNVPSFISHQSVDRSSEGFNWMIIASVTGGIGIIFFIVAMIIWYSKKNRSENSKLTTEGIPLLNSIPDNLHVLQIAGRLDKRLESLKHLERYGSEIGNHYTSFKDANNKEKAIEDLKKIQEALTKFLEPKKSSNKDKDKDKDKIIFYKLESALLIVESLMQRYSLLSLSNPNCENNYITEQQKLGLVDANNLLLNTIEVVRIDFEGHFFSKYNLRDNESKLKYLTLLLNLEKASYDASLCAHLEGYFENYERNEVINRLNLKKSDSNPGVNNEIDWKNLEKLQQDLAVTIHLTIIPLQTLLEELLKLNDEKLVNAIKLCINKFRCMESQLNNYSGFCKAGWKTSSQSQKQAQASVGSGSPTIFKQPKSPQNIKLSRKFTM